MFEFVNLIVGAFVFLGFCEFGVCGFAHLWPCEFVSL